MLGIYNFALRFFDIQTVNFYFLKTFSINEKFTLFLKPKTYCRTLYLWQLNTDFLSGGFIMKRILAGVLAFTMVLGGAALPAAAGEETYQKFESISQYGAGSA